MKNLIPKTMAYINAVEDDNRAGHHVYCVTMRASNSHTPLDDMSSEQLAAFDTLQLDYLKRLDSTSDETKGSPAAYDAYAAVDPSPAAYDAYAAVDNNNEVTK